MSIESILSIIDVKGSPQRVLLELLTSGPQSATFLAKKLSLPRPSIYDALNFLKEKSLIVSQEENGKNIFSISNPNAIAQLIDASNERLESAKEEFSQIVPELLKSPRFRNSQRYSGSKPYYGYYENENYIISWCRGHLLELKYPE